MYHDSELQNAEAKRNNDAEQRKIDSSAVTVVRHKREFEEITNNEEDSDTAVKKIKKKHFGLSEDLVPSQKVLRHLEKVSGEGNRDL